MQTAKTAAPLASSLTLAKEPAASEELGLSSNWEPDATLNDSSNVNIQPAIAFSQQIEYALHNLLSCEHFSSSHLSGAAASHTHVHSPALACAQNFRSIKQQRGDN
jgi:hypothetical protein